MDHATLLKMLMVCTVVPLAVSVALFFAGYVFDPLFNVVAVLYVVGRGFFVVWCVALVVAVIEYVRARRKGNG